MGEENGRLKKFLTLPETGSVDGILGDELLLNHLKKLEGLRVTTYVPEVYTEAMINFTYKGFEFDIDNTNWQWEFWVKGECPQSILIEIEEHCRLLLDAG